MTTRDTSEGYFAALSEGGEWQAFLADGVVFTRHTSPTRQISGRDAYLEATKRFYSMIQSFELQRLLVEGDRGCAFTCYTLKPPAGEPFESDVAEPFAVKDDEIYFDPAPYAT